jgi:hypothetical protein
VNFKNELERRTFEIARRVCGHVAQIEHNKTLRIEIADSPEVASFVGPPKKEVDVVTAGFGHSPDVKVLISCKDYRQSKAEPADVQEWAAVVKTMNQYSAGTKFLGLIISPSGFTSGCEPWATSYNLGERYRLLGKGWLSSFQELVKTFRGQTLKEIKTTSVGLYLSFSDNLTFRMTGGQIQFGPDDARIDGNSVVLRCEKEFPR